MKCLLSSPLKGEGGWSSPALRTQATCFPLHRAPLRLPLARQAPPLPLGAWPWARLKRGAWSHSVSPKSVTITRGPGFQRRLAQNLTCSVRSNGSTHQNQNQTSCLNQVLSMVSGSCTQRHYHPTFSLPLIQLYSSRHTEPANTVLTCFVPVFTFCLLDWSINRLCFCSFAVSPGPRTVPGI